VDTSASVQERVNLVLGELSRASAAVNWEQWERLPGLTLQSKAVFAVGSGRSGLALRMGAMRLMHLGRIVHVVGETTTPAIRAGDLLIAVSGSGSTSAVVHAAEVARTQDAVVAAITTNASSDLARAATHVLIIPAAEKTHQVAQVSQQYAGTLFEQMVIVLLDAVFHELWQRSGVPGEELYRRHSNLG